MLLKYRTRPEAMCLEIRHSFEHHKLSLSLRRHLNILRLVKILFTKQRMMNENKTTNRHTVDFFC